jgi:polysaccharide biosynthesis protein PslH
VDPALTQDPNANPMRILFVANEVPFPPDNGVRIASYYAMRLMREAGHELALAVLTEERDVSSKRFSEAAALCEKEMAWWMPLPRRNRLFVQIMASVHRALFFVERYSCNQFRQKLVGLIETFKPNVIHFDIITLAQYFDTAPLRVGTVASINDSYALTMKNELAEGKYAGIERLYRKIQFEQVCNYEAAQYPKFDAVHVMSEVDAVYLGELNPAINSVVISNGVDGSLFEIADQTQKRTDIIFVAKMVGDNLESLSKFLKWSWPRIKAEQANVKLHVVGKLGPEAQSLQVQARGETNILFRGYIENLADVYRDCGIAIVPINKNCGLINKAIEAMAAGLAVVGFNKTFAGIKEVIPGRHCVVAADYAGFGLAVVELIRDDYRRHTIQRAAHNLAKQSYSWPTRSESYDNMYRSSVERASSKASAA